MLKMATHGTEGGCFPSKCLIPGLFTFSILVKSDSQTLIGLGSPMQSNTTLNNTTQLDSCFHREAGDQMLYCLQPRGLENMGFFFFF